MARVAAALYERKAWFACFHRNKEDFAREKLGRSARWLQDLVRLQRTLDALPRLATAVTGADGCEPLGQMAALAIGRVATPANVEGWIARARSGTLAALRQQVATAAAHDAARASRSSSGTARATPARAPSKRPVTPTS